MDCPSIVVKPLCVANSHFCGSRVVSGRVRLVGERRHLIVGLLPEEKCPHCQAEWVKMQQGSKEEGNKAK